MRRLKILMFSLLLLLQYAFFSGGFTWGSVFIEEPRRGDAYDPLLEGSLVFFEKKIMDVLKVNGRQSTYHFSICHRKLCPWPSDRVAREELELGDRLFSLIAEAQKSDGALLRFGLFLRKLGERSAGAVWVMRDGGDKGIEILCSRPGP